MKRNRGMSPIISGVKRARNILLNSNEFSSEIKAFEPKEYFNDYPFITFVKNKIKFIHGREANLVEAQD